jgi:Tfp pilus assembly protein PilV
MRMSLQPSRKQGQPSASSSQAGFTLLELLLAGVVMLVGLSGGLLLVLMAISSNRRNNLDSSGTVLAQMTMEMIASVPSNSNSSVSVVDCNPTTSSATHALSTLGSSSGSGAPLTSGGAIDFSQAQVTGYSMLYYSCQASTGDRQILFDIRWNIKTLTTNTKLVIVAAQRTGANNNAVLFAVPVSLKTIVGL